MQNFTGFLNVRSFLNVNANRSLSFRVFIIPLSLQLGHYGISYLSLVLESSNFQSLTEALN